MKLKEIAAISGKPGLFKILKPTKNGVIVESLDDKKAKMVAGASHRVSILQEVSIYATNSEGSVALAQVLHTIYTQYPEGVQLDAKSSEADYRNFLEQIVPDYERTKVYASDMRKLVTWYHTILKYSPETFATLLEVETPATVAGEAKTAKATPTGEAEATPAVETPVETAEATPAVETPVESDEPKTDPKVKNEAQEVKETKKTSKKKTTE
ncbi:MAG: DUF5606 domain-containing protein [Microscillaceae bacterium]|jgi:hypothetical protein|nr:DUF5606 domain-containing protein [Microscillaceae bacterium]